MRNHASCTNPSRTIPVTSQMNCDAVPSGARLDDCELTLFADGRAIVKGTDDPDRARVLYSKYVGD